jgi:hypothetical protein
MKVYPGAKPISAGDDDAFETSAGHVNMAAIKAQVEESQGAATFYHTRISSSFDWWQSRWDGQTFDGRKWWKLEGESDVFPWPGASDARIRLVKRLVNEKRTLEMYALLNMKLQAQSWRPEASGQASGQATTLINWQLFSHMLSEWYTQSELAIVWAAVTGSSVISVDWEQERRLQRVNLSLEQFADALTKITKSPVPFQVRDVQEMLDSGQYDKDLIEFTKALSPVLKTGDAKKIINDLRDPDKGAAIVPVPYLFRNKPRILALRPMIDVFFQPEASDLQRDTWIDRVEYVSEEILTDRIETADYDKGFVEEAIKLKGIYSTQFGWADWLYRGFDALGLNMLGPHNIPSATNIRGRERVKLVELHHFYHYALDYGVPCVYKTVFHLKVPDYANHETLEYDHGEMPFHGVRNETDHAPLLSSMGIPENTYTWEREAKAQIDARTDRASLALAPPIFAAHGETLKMKRAFVPNGVIATLPGRESKFAAVPPYDPGSIEITLDIERRAREHYAWFGNDLDPALKQMRQGEVADKVMNAFKPIVQQIGQLDDQFLPDEAWIRVTGLPPPRNSHDPEAIRQRWDLTMTCDVREIDMEFLEKKAKAIGSILPIDTAGIVDRTVIVRELFQGFSYTLADMSIRDPQSATQKEIDDEMAKVSLIIGSGIEQPLPPQGSNFGLRLQTMTNLVQHTPGIKMRMAQDPAVLKAIENRYLYLTRQIQQHQQNPGIGRALVGSANNPQQAPMIAEKTAGAGGY